MRVGINCFEAAWRNGIASDYESGDCRFDPCGGHLIPFTIFVLTRKAGRSMRFTQIHRFPERMLSTVHRGTAFEKRALALLTEHMSMSLTRVGGSYDGGIDLIGWWWVPSESSTTCASLAMNVTSSRALPAQKPLFARVWPYMHTRVRSSPCYRKAQGLERGESTTTTRPRSMQSRKAEDGAWIPTTTRRRRVQILQRCHFNRFGPRSLQPQRYRDDESTPSHRRAPRLRIRLYAQLSPRRTRLAPPIPPRAHPPRQTSRRPSRRHLWKSGLDILAGRVERPARNPLGTFFYDQWRTSAPGGRQSRCRCELERTSRVVVAGTTAAKLDTRWRRRWPATALCLLIINSGQIKIKTNGHVVPPHYFGRPHPFRMRRR